MIWIYCMRIYVIRDCKLKLYYVTFRVIYVRKNMLSLEKLQIEVYVILINFKKTWVRFRERLYLREMLDIYISSIQFVIIYFREKSSRLYVEDYTIHSNKDEMSYIFM